MGDVTGTVAVGAQQLFQYRYGPDLLPSSTGPRFGPGMWRYRGLLPLAEGPIRYPLPVGGTPLLAASRLGASLGVAHADVWIKDETWGPSASNKDRATALVIESVLRRGAGAITTSSTGNAGVATAIGAAAAGLASVIFVAADCDASKVGLMRAAGALVIPVEGGYAAAGALSRAAADAFGWEDRNTGVNPATIEAKKTVAFEIWEQLGAIPDAVVVPVGDGPTLVGMAKGFQELRLCGAADRVPAVIGVQAACCQPLVQAWLGVEPGPELLDPGGTAADGIAVATPSSGPAAIDAVERSGGAFVAVTDAQVESAMARLAADAGVLAEPAGAASVAGLVTASDRGHLDGAAVIVALVTGRTLAVPSTGSSGTTDDQVVRDLDDVAHLVALHGVPGSLRGPA